LVETTVVKTPPETRVKVAALPSADEVVVKVLAPDVRTMVVSLPVATEETDPGVDSVKVEIKLGAAGMTVVIVVLGPTTTTL